MKPGVSVVMPVRNGERFVQAAIASMLQQTLAVDEVVVVENGSTDRTPEILRELSAADARVNVVTTGPDGLVAALNVGLRHASGEFVARMDADDVAAPERLRAQVDHLRRHCDVVMVGTSFRYVDEALRERGIRRLPTRPAHVAADLYFGNPICHPSVVFARERLDEELRYAEGYPGAEDYELWLRLTRDHQIANLGEVLLDYRLHDGAVTFGASDPTAGIDAVEAHRGGWRGSRWVFAGVYNAQHSGTSFGRFVVSVTMLNLRNLIVADVGRWALLQRSLRAGGSLLRRRWGHRRGGSGPRLA